MRQIRKKTVKSKKATADEAKDFQYKLYEKVLS
jgi:hypothetical protein